MANSEGTGRTPGKKLQDKAERVVFLFHIREGPPRGRPQRQCPTTMPEYVKAATKFDNNKGAGGITTAGHGIENANVVKVSLSKPEWWIADEALANKWALAVRTQGRHCRQWHPLGLQHWGGGRNNDDAVYKDIVDHDAATNTNEGTSIAMRALGDKKQEP